MKSTMFKTSLLKAGLAALSLALTGVAMAQGEVTLVAGPSITALPDGRSVHMWGYTCGDAIAVPAPLLAPAPATNGASCTALNGSPQSGTAWQPPLITVAKGSSLTIHLVNNLSFAAGTNTVPTSLVIVGQLGGGLGKSRVTTPSPVHAPQGTTWPGTLGGIDPATLAVTVQSGGSGYVTPPEVAITGGGGSGANAVATIASGQVVAVPVTSPGTGYTSNPTVTIAAPPSPGTQATATLDYTILNGSDGSPTFVPPPQVDRVRSLATEVNVSDGATGAALTWNNLRPGTYLIHSGTQPSIQHPMGLYGVLVVTDNDTNTSPVTPRAYGQAFDKDVALLLSEIDAEQNEAVNLAVTTVGFTDTAAWNAQSGQCGDPAVHTCYPPAVNYTPLYYLVNGVAFDRSSSAANGANVASVPAIAKTGKVLVRMVNAGLHSHVPNIIGMPLTLLAEDGNALPGSARIQNSILLTAGKTYDTMIQPSASGGSYSPAALAVFDRSLGLSTNNQRDGGMQAYITVAAGAAAGSVGSSASSVTLSAADKTYYCVAGTTLSVTDPKLGLLAGTVGANGLALGAVTGDVSTTTLVLNSNGTFTYRPSAGTVCGGSFAFLVNGTLSKTATIAQCDANSSSASGCALAAAPMVGPIVFRSSVATRYASTPPGVLSGVTGNAAGLLLTAQAGAGGSVAVNADGSFIATNVGASSANCVGAGLTFGPTGSVPTGTTCTTFPYQVKNSQGRASAVATATVAFLPASNLNVALVDAKTGNAITDYRWIIEEDKTFWIDPKCQVNDPRPGARVDSRGNACPPLPVESLGYNFHTAHMPVIAQGCVGTASCEQGQMVTDTSPGSPTFGQHVAGVCDVGNGICRADPSGKKTPVAPGSVYLDPSKRYFISVLPGDGVNPTIGGPGAMQVDATCDPAATLCKMRPFDIAKDCGVYTGPTGKWEPAGANAMCGHEMGGAQLSPGQQAVKIALQQTPLPTAKISVFVFQDDNPLNGENDAGGGVDQIAPNEAGLSGFEIKLFDQAGQLGDNTGQITYDEFNQPVSNALAGTVDPITKLDACPITARKDGLVGMIPTCPKYESDGVTPSPLAGQAVIANLYPGLYEIQAYPAADRIARGEEWLQTNTLDGGKPHEAFIKPNEPGYFQEFGPGGFHVAIGFANPKIINARKDAYCASPLNNGGACNHTLTVNVSNNHMSRTPDQRTFSSETYDHYSFTNCYVSVGLADAQDFAFQKCDADGKAVFTNMPNGVFKIAVFDQWNDIMLDGLVGTVSISGDTVKNFPVTQWRTNLFTRTYIDSNGDGVSQDSEPGLALVNTNIRYRDGSYGFFNNTDLNGYAGFNEVFPFMSWLVVETSLTRFKPTGVHTVYDAGGPVDCSGAATAMGLPCSTIAANLASTSVGVPLPKDLRLPGAVYCATADCDSENLLNRPADGGTGSSTGMIAPPQAFGTSQAWQGLLGQNTFMEFGVKPFAEHENGGISGMVVYASTRPFDDPSLSLQLSWEPGVPHAKINLYSKTIDASGNEKLMLVDTTYSASFDDWAQGFRQDANGNLISAGSGAQAGFVPNMNCPGQDPTSPFFATLKNSKQWLDTSDASGNKKALAYNSQFKCYDGWSQLNQAQPAPYDGKYQFPSRTAMGADGKPAASNCHMATADEPWGCVLNTAAAPGDWDFQKAMLQPGKYVVEIVVPPGYELVKEEDKNILLGDVFIAPVSQQFAGFGNVFIMPDQATINSAYNRNNPGGLNKTQTLGSFTFPRHEGDTGSVEAYWACVGAERIVPDFNSLFPQAGQASPFAGAKRRLCDRKEVEIEDQGSVLTKFYVFSSTHVAGHFTGTMTNDFASEFDPFSPQFGEKFGPPNLPVGMRDFNGNEVARVYSDQWGLYNGLYFSTWSVNPPNPTGYAPQMSIACMNDPGPIAKTNAAGQFVKGSTVVATADLADQITDPAYSPAYSNFCYETPFMPGFTAYMDTPVIPTMAFADGYNLPDTEYPDGTPVILSVVSDSAPGPWLASGGAVTSVTPGNNRGSFSATPVPTVGFGGGGGGSGAAAVAVMGINAIANLTNAAGGRYSSGTPSFTFTPTACPSGVPCVAATGTAIMTPPGANRRVSSIDVTAANMGSGFTSLSAVTVTITCTGTCSQQTAATPTVASLRINSFVVTAGGSGYTSAPNVNLSPGGGASAPTAAINAGAGGTLTITALGDKAVQNPNFSGPNATVAPYNQKTITRHYDFGTTPGTVALVGSDGVARPLTGVSWSNTTITGIVPSTLPNCIQQQRNAPAAKCGQLVITRGDNGKQSIDAITVTMDGSKPWVVTQSGVKNAAGQQVADNGAAFGRMGPSWIQTAIDLANPGDLILVTPGTYRENLIMWKPVRLQGVGAGSVTINADAHPAGKMDQWRRQINCTFGLDLNGVPNPGNQTFDQGNAYACPAYMHQRVDRIPFEAIIGWDAGGNGNLAQVLQEPTLMGAYEGAGITVLGRGVRTPNCRDANFGANCSDFWGQNATGGAGAFTDGSVYIDGTNAYCNTASPTLTDGRDYGTSNFYCNPSRIDGVSVLNSSQGGGGVFIHGWAHNLEVANTHISANHGTLAGAINLGNGETPDAFINDGIECNVPAAQGPQAVTCPPVPSGTVAGAVIPFQFNTKVRIHHNMLNNNASIGDALFSGTPSGAGAITVSAGADNYRIDHNWIAGNLSTGDGGGLQHLGLSFNGRIDHNYVLYNQSTNPTLPTNGGGIAIEGANLDRTLNGTECGSTSDQDCPPGLSEGTGANLVIDANLILGNSAESGSGGGLRLSQINGSGDVVAFPNCPVQITTGPNNQRCQGGWYDVTVTNNIIANNVAGYDGGGVSMQDALLVKMVNNTIAANDSTASAGVLFKTLGAIYASAPPPGCNPTTDPTLPQNPNCEQNAAPHGPQPAGLVLTAHTPNLISGLAGLGINCSVSSITSFGYTGGDCLKVSKPNMVNNLFWQNRSFSVNIVDRDGNVVTSPTQATGTGLQSQQNLVALTPALSQRATGECPAGANVWDIGLRTDDVNSGFIPPSTRLALLNSIYTGDGKTATVIGGAVNGSANNLSSAGSPMVAPFCNGARIPPEHCNDAGIDNGSASCKGFNAPVGASETTSLNQVFTFSGIQPTATVDEGHNWINLIYGPLTLSRPNAPSSTPGEVMLVPGASGLGTTVGAYSIPRGSVAVGNGATGNSLSTTMQAAVSSDFFGNARPINNTKLDIGAVALTTTAASVRPTALAFGAVAIGSTGQQIITLAVGNAPLTGITVSVATATPSGAPLFSRVSGGTCPANGGALATATGTCTIVVGFTPTAAAAGPATGSVTVTATGGGPILGSPVALTGNGAVLALNPAPSALVFPPVTLGQGSGAQYVTLQNLSASAVTGITTTVAGTGFQKGTGGNAGTCASSASLSPNATCTVGVTFMPTMGGSASGTLTLSTSPAVSVGGPVTLIGDGLLPPPVLNAPLNPSTGYRNTSTTVTLTGQYLTGATAVNVVGVGITVSDVAVVDDSHVTATFTIANNAALDIARNVAVVTPVGTSNAEPFTVVSPPPPTLKGVSPNSGVRPPTGSASYPVTLTGTNLVGVTLTESSNGQNFTLSNITVVNATTITATVHVGSGATYGAKALTVTDSTGQTSTVNFNVVSAIPVAFTAQSGQASLNGSGTTLDFGRTTGLRTDTVTVTIGGTTAVAFQTATVTNVTGTAFSKGADTCSGQPKNPGDTCTIVVNFNAAGGNSARAGTLSAPYTGAAGGPVILALTGQ